jgi:hypothetical protein
MAKSDTLIGKNTPFVEAVHTGTRQRPTAILLRTSWTTGDKGAANGVAQAWHNPNNKLESCHYVVDAATVIRCVPDKVEAFPIRREKYKGAVSINICYDPPFLDDMLVVMRAAELTARLCKLHRIRLRLLNEEESVSWRRHSWRFRGGILNKTVGDFPTKDFFTFVEEEYKGF